MFLCDNYNGIVRETKCVYAMSNSKIKTSVFRMMQNFLHKLIDYCEILRTVLYIFKL